MCIFRADHFVLDNKLMCSSLRRVFLSASIAWLPEVLCGGWGSPSLLSVHFSMHMVSVLVQYMFGQTCWWDFMRVASESTRRHNPTENFVIFWLLEYFCSYFWMPIEKIQTKDHASADHFLCLKTIRLNISELTLYSLSPSPSVSRQLRMSAQNTQHQTSILVHMEEK